MIYQVDNPVNMLGMLASLIIKDGGDLSDILVFVPTRRIARGLEKELVGLLGAVMLPKIVPLGEGDDFMETAEIIENSERKIMLAKILMSVADKVDVPNTFAGALSVAGELVTMVDYLENEGLDAREINWAEYIPDERKAAFLNAIKDVDFGVTKTQERNRGILNWKKRLGEFRAVFCAGSTASVKPVRELLTAIANLPNGHIIFPGFLTPDSVDIGRTDPYWSIKQFLSGINHNPYPLTSDFVKTPSDKLPDPFLEKGDLGSADSRIMFFNKCFVNDLSGEKVAIPGGIVQVDADTEAEEAVVVAFIAARARHEKKSVLVITPDSAGEQRIKAAMDEYNLSADSSAGTPLFMTRIGRFALRLFDWLVGDEKKEIVEKELFYPYPVPLAGQDIVSSIKYEGKLWDFIVNAMESLDYQITDCAETDAFFNVVANLSPILEKYNLSAEDTAIMFADALKSESVRMPFGAECDVQILGTAESRMQTADVVIITGLNDGMFPAKGFEHSWLPRNIAHQIGLPSSDSKVSLQALDFMTLSCAPEVYWTRSKMSGGSETVPSRFLSRVNIMADVPKGDGILTAVRARNNMDLSPLDTTPPVVKYAGDYYATWLESLIHNPYLFYARHILRLKLKPDVGDEIGAKEFGTFVHSVLEKCVGLNDAQIIVALEAEALKYVQKDSVLFRFWQNRFREMAPEIEKLLSVPGAMEQKIEMNYVGRRLIAKADRIEGNRVIDYKTGIIPSDKQLGLAKDENCTMPQLPVEAMILKNKVEGEVSMAFMSLKKGDVRLKEFNHDTTARAIAAVKKKLNIIINKEKFERPEYVQEKYRDFDDLCRAGD